MWKEPVGWAHTSLSVGRPDCNFLVGTGCCYYEQEPGRWHPNGARRSGPESVASSPRWGSRSGTVHPYG